MNIEEYKKNNKKAIIFDIVSIFILGYVFSGIAYNLFNKNYNMSLNDKDKRNKAIAGKVISSFLLGKSVIYHGRKASGFNENAYSISLVSGLIISLITLMVLLIKNKKVLKNNSVSNGMKKNSKFRCSECGALVDENADFCPKCGEKFEDKENIKESVSKPKNDKKLKKEDKKNVKKKKTLKFKCSECGALIDEDSEFCPNCGEKFEDDEIEIIDENNREENFDDKYDNLKKLKKLLDEGIITKEEFENEKKKILNEK